VKNALVQKHYYNVGENQRQQRIFIFNPNQKREKKISSLPTAPEELFFRARLSVPAERAESKQHVKV